MNVPSPEMKPWESNKGSSFYTSGNQAPHVDRLYSAPVPYPGAGGGGGNFTHGVPTIVAPPPPLPPRPFQTRPIYSASSSNSRNLMQPHSAYTNYSAPYYQSPYANFNTYRHGNYSHNRLPAPPPGSYVTNTFPGDEEPTIAELAQESSASAFQSIESFVSAFRSISSMLDSTFHAIYSSFRAVVEVADQLTRVKQILHTLAIFRFLRWTLRRIMYLIGISKIKPEQIESVWNSVLSEKGSHLSDTLLKPANKSAWPIIAFLGFILAGPYLVWKLLASLNHKAKAPKWATGETEHVVATVEYDFEPGSSSELRLERGSRIRLAPSALQPDGIEGWVLASDGSKIGLVPLNYIKVIGKENPATLPEVNNV